MAPKQDQRPQHPCMRGDEPSRRAYVRSADADTRKALEQEMGEWRVRLLTAARPDDLLRFLSDFGLEAEHLAVALGGISVRSVRRWLLEGLPGTQRATTWRMLDDLRAIVGHLLADGTYDRAGIVAWLTSRQSDLHYERPIDALGRGAFEEVLKAAEQMAASGRADNKKLQHYNASQKRRKVNAPLENGSMARTGSKR
jgi:hypothetical protein